MADEQKILYENEVAFQEVKVRYDMVNRRWLGPLPRLILRKALELPRINNTSIEPESMSAVAVSYDPGFSMESRSSFTWPVMDSESGLLPPDMSHHYGSEASLSPPSGSRSITGSPRRHAFTPEQRGLKRQRDQARHTSKLHARGRRMGNSSESVYSSPVTLADLTAGSSAMPVYTTAPSQMSLIAEPSAPHYLPPFSPPLPDQSQTSMFTSPYPPHMPDYSYQPSPALSLPSHDCNRPQIARFSLYLPPSNLQPRPCPPRRGRFWSKDKPMRNFLPKPSRNHQIFSQSWRILGVVAVCLLLIHTSNQKPNLHKLQIPNARPIQVLPRHTPMPARPPSQYPKTSPRLS
ncbi:hypothetical protein QBC36DRAFT_341558 [Triangularia setosa]|uniref:Uncharacterized protein n=1 Tax=Triangularia setosa TaxID=2587417 RepID=A0AAN6VVV2_9PEZI|nr:hypothetical protein QBC36DRAFT_341558 [Podospora setosa]